MLMSLINKILLVLLIIGESVCFAQQDQTDIIVDNGKESIVVLNDQLRRTSRRLRELEGGVSLTTGVTGILPVSKGGTGQNFSSATTGSIPYFSSTGVMGNVGIGTNGNVLKVSSGIPTWGTSSNIQVFTSSGTYTAPAGVTRVYLSMVGGGGGGGEVSRGGGGGSSIINYPFTVTPGNNYTVTIGAGGLGRVSGLNEETDGGSTSFDSVVVLGGKSGSLSGTAASSPNTTSSTGGAFGIAGGTSSSSGGGGSSFGSGGTGSTGSGTVGSGYGAGGGANGTEGANGTSGLVIVMW